MKCILPPRLQYKDLQDRVKESASTFLLARDQREQLVAKRVCTLRRPSRKLMFERARLDVAIAVEQTVAIFWVDNFNRVHFRNRPAHREGHVNGTAVAVAAALDVVPRPWTGHPPLAALVRRVADGAHALRLLEGDFAYELVAHIGQLDLDRIRVPCDIMRVGVQAADWWPYDIQGLNISTSEGLVDVLSYLKEEAAKLKLLMAPVLCDVNIYWRINRFMYSESYNHLDVHRALSDHPVVFGMWHCYVHCVRRVWAVFRSWWMPVEYPELLGVDPGSVTCYDFPALIQLEHTILALAYHGPGMKRAIEDARREVAASVSSDVARKEHSLMLLDMLKLFLTEYAPCLFQLGIEVRHCYWLGRERWTGSTVKPLLGKFIVFLSKLCWNTPAAFEYCRSSLLAYLSWSEVHDQLPAALHVEECLEASLSRLAAISQHAHHFDNEADLAMLYCATCKASRQVKDLMKPGVSKKFVEDVGKFLPNLVAACKLGTLPYVPLKSAGHRSAGALVWPDQPIALPLRLTISEHALDYNALFLRALKLVSSALSATSQPNAISFHLETKLCAGLLPLGTQARQLRLLAAIEVADKLKVLQRETAPKKKAKPPPVLVTDLASSSSAAVDNRPERSPSPVPTSPCVASPRTGEGMEEDLQSILSEDPRPVGSEDGDLDEYIVPYLDDVLESGSEEEVWEVDPLALV